MSIQVHVPGAALADPAVAVAVARLIESLAHHGRPHPAFGPPIEAFTPIKRGRGRPRKTEAIPPPIPSPPRVMPPVLGRTAGNFEAFFAALPERSRDFLTLLQARGTLSIDEAMSRLGILAGKAVGGLTGSIARWAPVHGVEVPFEAFQGPDGKRAWRWTGPPAA